MVDGSQLRPSQERHLLKNTYAKIMKTHFVATAMKFVSPPTDVLASLKASKASLESTRKRIEDTIDRNEAIKNAAQEIEEQGKIFRMRLDK